MDGKKKKTEIGKLASVPLREVWKREADDFTPWLYENLDILAAELKFSLEPEEREKRINPIGGFSADIVASDDEGRLVVIENQYGKTDHIHLGQLLTYVANLGDIKDIKAAVWIVEEPRDEHRRAVEWLDEAISDIDFYLVRAEIWKINDSSPAAKFTVVAGPTETARVIGNARREETERHKSRRQFWQELLDKVGKQTNLFASRNTTKGGWMGASSGMRGINFQFTTLEDSAAVRLYIDRGDQEENQVVFEQLKAHRADIEKKFGEDLLWEAPERNRYRRISSVFKPGRNAEGAEREKLLNEMAEKMSKLENALKEYIKKLPR